MYFQHNTVYGNETDPNQVSMQDCGEIQLYSSLTTEVSGNLTQSTAATGCGGNTIYNYTVQNGDGTDHVYSNFGYSSLGNNTAVFENAGFFFGPNNTFADPAFANPTDPGAPSCSGKVSVPDCMATVIANFTPMNVAAKGYGYQVPSSTSVYNPLFPQWLCNVNLPSGLVSMGCQTGP